MPKADKNIRKVIIRLYRQFDLDLIYLFETLTAQNADTQTIIKSILRAYLNGEEPNTEEQEAIHRLLHPAVRETVPLRFKLQYQLKLHTTDDADLLKWIEGIRIGYRNTSIKSTIRSYIKEPCLFPCLATTELHFVDSRAWKED